MKPIRRYGLQKFKLEQMSSVHNFFSKSSTGSKAHIAVATLFLANGMMFGNVLPRIPVLKEKLQLDEGDLGLALLCLALGSISIFPFAAALIRKLTSSFVSTYAGIGLMVSIIPIALAWDWYSIALVLLVLGWSNGLMDIAMNMQVVEVEKLRKKAVMSQMHGLWSVGSLIGGAMCGGFTYFGIALFPHFVFVSGICAFAIWATRSWVVSTEVKKSEGGWMLPSKYLLVLGIIGFCAAMAESVSMEWTALFLAERLPEGSAWTVAGFITFAAAMVLGRFTGDKLIAKFRTRYLLLACSTSVMFGYTFMLSMNTAWAAAIGYGFAGLGISIIAPLVYGAGARDTTRPPGVGLTLVTAIGYAGFVIGAPMIGFIAEASSLRFALWVIVVLMALLMLLTTQVSEQKE